MAIVFRAPTDDPYGCFHPEAKGRGFDEGDKYWASVSAYCAAHEDALEALPRALALSFERNLGHRAILVGTGDEAIEADLGDDAVLGIGLDGRGANRLGRALEAVRAIVRVRALDATAIQCAHQQPEGTEQACVHLLADFRSFHRMFTGEGARFVSICVACHEALPSPPPLRTICRVCFADMLVGHRKADVGEPAFLSRASSIHFSHARIEPKELPSDILAIAAIPRRAHGFIALDRSGASWRIDLANALPTRIHTLEEGAIDLAEAVVLVVAPDGDFFAVGEAKGVRAVVVDCTSAAVTMQITRGDYYPEHCRFPLGFFELEGRALLVHATDWNRLDVSDPRTGACLTERGPTSYKKGEQRPAHYLDYFHAGLVISPSGRYALDNGWVWHPFGIARVFDLHRWVNENPWESEDGPSVHGVCDRAYFWDGPAVWLDDRRFVLWGDGDDDTELTPAALVFDAETGDEVIRFAGPPKGFVSVGAI